MTPGARAAAAIELLNVIEAEGRPADRCVATYFAARRYAGSKDRRAISERVFAVLRHRAALDWWLARGGEPAPSARARAIAALALLEGCAAPDISGLFDGGRHGPAPLEEAERTLAAGLVGPTLRSPEQPPWVRCEAPDWLYARFAETFEAEVEAELSALIASAPVDLRVNGLKADRAAARAVLAEDGIVAEPTPVSPLGLRLAGRAPLAAARAYRQGLVEVQDEGSQAVALLCDARPGMTVVDFCAGAGGKSLALAAQMGGPGRREGRLIALDVDGARLSRARPRLERAGAGWVETRAIEGPRDPWLAGLAGRCERVLVDAPCSGSGAWRRQPDARWRLTPEALADYRAAQDEALAAAAPLVAPGGWLIYATCSLLNEENGVSIGRFLASHDAFAPLDPEPVWRSVLGGPCPRQGEGVLLSPARCGTDGFYVALLERAA